MGEGTQPSGLMCTLTLMCGGVKLPHRFHFSRRVHIAEQLPMASVKVHVPKGPTLDPHAGLVRSLSPYLEGQVVSFIQCADDRLVRLPCQLSLVSLPLLVSLQSKEDIEGVDPGLLEELSVSETLANNIAVRGQRFEESYGRHLAKISYHGRHRHVLKQGSP